MAESSAPEAASEPQNLAGSGSSNVKGRITPQNVLANERYWPDIVALEQPWLPPDSERPLKKGYRGALVRVDDRGRARIAFGRHGNHDIPMEFTDLISRANEVESGTRFKVAPNFLAQYGTQFLHPSTPKMIPYPTLELATSDRFLCVFASPDEPGFKALAIELAKLEDLPGLQLLFFPLATSAADLERVKTILQDVSWTVPFAYPQAAEVHARSLLGEVPTAAEALLVTAEGRLLYRAALSDPGALDLLRAAAAAAPRAATAPIRHIRHRFVHESTSIRHPDVIVCCFSHGKSTRWTRPSEILLRTASAS